MVSDNAPLPAVLCDIWRMLLTKGAEAAQRKVVEVVGEAAGVQVEAEAEVVVAEEVVVVVEAE